ncbi:hypothetical protein [Chondromyces apiculatus]|uniref:Uncharacterized protein n=1 Tax=Chondromyces apiculatus DSM 436 TaxID=1192034 RepID=A0A017T3C7_9BACT|nr:hypothetical protein [Chondromyces apiculatus]EYF03355.1 Hypothetical protein CAP_5687 [Chondromyces apiculatus DSM 436]
MLTSWFSAFFFTQCVEMPIYARLAKAGWIAAFGASALTHPIVWFVIPSFFPGNYWRMVAVAEAFAVIAEALYLHFGFRVKRALLWSLLANATSVTLGFLSRHFFGWP